MSIEEGIKAPDFILQDENRKDQKLSEYRGTPVLLYFYPKDDTPGCTKEACNFRDDYSLYQEARVVILGVSPDSPEKHTKFREKYSLPFSLLADEEHKVAELYGVWALKKSFGREYFGIVRTTFLISPDGLITKIFKKVRPAEHSAEVLEALDELLLSLYFLKMEKWAIYRA